MHYLITKVSRLSILMLIDAIARRHIESCFYIIDSDIFTKFILGT